MIRRNTVPLNPRPDGVARYSKHKRHLFGPPCSSNDFGMRQHDAMMHDASALVKCLMHHPNDYSEIMNSPANRLKSARIDAGYSSAKLAAEAMGVSVATYIQHENGTRGFPADRAQRYARFFRTTPEWLLYGRDNTDKHLHVSLGPQIPIMGAVGAGLWREVMEYPEAEWATFTGAANIKAPISQRFGLQVVGDSMDLLYPSGTILECVRYWGDHPIPNGRRVIVQRHRSDGMIETTVKEYMEDKDGVCWLVPRSSNPAFQAPFRCDQPEPGVEKVEVIAIVIASTRYE